jgi:hypothetical protein
MRGAAAFTGEAMTNVVATPTAMIMSHWSLSHPVETPTAPTMRPNSL